MRDELKEEIKDIKEQWKRKEMHWEGKIKMVKEKIENMVIGGVNEDLQGKIKKLEKQENIRERKEKRNNIVIKGWKIPKRDSLETAVEEMLQRELHAEVKVIEAIWTKRETNMVTAKLYDKEQKRIVMIRKNNLKGKNIIIDNDLTWKEKQIQREIRAIAEAEKIKGAKVKIGYRKLQVDERKFIWREEKGSKGTKFLEPTELCRPISRQAEQEGSGNSGELCNGRDRRREARNYKSKVTQAEKVGK